MDQFILVNSLLISVPFPWTLSLQVWSGAAQVYKNDAFLEAVDGDINNIYNLLSFLSSVPHKISNQHWAASRNPNSVTQADFKLLPHLKFQRKVFFPKLLRLHTAQKGTTIGKNWYIDALLRFSFISHLISYISKLTTFPSRNAVISL